jgi:cytochrome P450
LEEKAMSETSLAKRFFVDAMSPGFREDPYPHYVAYRSEEPLLRVDDTVWFALAHQDVATLLRHPKLSSNETRATTEQDRPEPGRLKARSPLFMDPPEHTRLRRLIARAFTAKRVDALRATAQATTSTPLDQLAVEGKSQVDLIEASAYPLPVRIICSLLGVPASDEEAFTGWSQALSRHSTRPFCARPR